MDNCLLLHIGTPKTGTSSIQHFLYNNRAVLMDEGWDYPDLKSEFSYIHDYASNKEKNGNVFYEGIKLYSEESEITKAIMSSIKKHIAEKNVILSAEEFYEYDTEELLKRLISHFQNIKVVVYIRRQDKYVESRWNQIIKDDRCYTGSFSDYLEYSDSWNEGHYLPMLDMISGYIGIQNIYVRAYEKEQLEKNNVVYDFCEILRIKDLSEINVEGTNTNDGLCPEMLEIKRIINEIYDVRKYGTGQNIVDVLCNMQKESGYKKSEAKGYFDDKERQRYLDSFKYENTVIAQKYLHREDGRLFYDTETRIDTANNMLNQTSSKAIQGLVRYLLEENYRANNYNLGANLHNE